MDDKENLPLEDNDLDETSDTESTFTDEDAFESRDEETVTAKENTKKKKMVKGIKAAYAFALILAVCGAFAAKVATEKALGSLKVPIESDYATTEKTTTKDSQRLNELPEDVANDVKNVPDTRPAVTEPEEIKVTVIETEASKYAVPFEGEYGLPLGTKISKDYSPDVPAYSATMGDWRSHAGVDFSGAEGSQIKAVSAGTVTGIYEDVLYGQIVEIDHGNGVTAKYCGIEPESLEVETGMNVETGTLLGYLGTVPCERSEVSHLHFETSVNGVTEDPVAVLGRE